MAQLTSVPSVTDLSKESENPVAALATLPIQYQGDLGYGKDGNAKSIGLTGFFGRLIDERQFGSGDQPYRR